MTQMRDGGKWECKLIFHTRFFNAVTKSVLISVKAFGAVCKATNKRRQEEEQHSSMLI